MTPAGAAGAAGAAGIGSSGTELEHPKQKTITIEIKANIDMFLFLVVCNRLPLSLKRLSWKVTERIRNFDPRG